LLFNLSKASELAFAFSSNFFNFASGVLSYIFLNLIAIKATAPAKAIKTPTAISAVAATKFIPIFAANKAAV
jgi:hypothetical protein